MKQHRWAKEIKAWADGAEIEWFNDGKRIYETRMIAETIDECEKALLVCNGCDLIYCECGEYDEIMD